jgi:hypothetical protein
MMTFDAASRDLCTVKRQETNTPIQALVLLNDPQLIEASRVLAANTFKRFPKRIEEQLAYIFQKATSRLPDDEEVSILLSHYKDMLNKINTNEIIASEYLKIGDYETDNSIPPVQLAALSLVTHTILNLDETITRG